MGTEKAPRQVSLGSEVALSTWLEVMGKERRLQELEGPGVLWGFRTWGTEEGLGGLPIPLPSGFLSPASLHPATRTVAT